MAPGPPPWARLRAPATRTIPGSWNPGGSHGFPIVPIHDGEAEDTCMERGGAGALRVIVGMLEGAVLQAGGPGGLADL